MGFRENAEGGGRGLGRKKEKNGDKEGEKGWICQGSKSEEKFFLAPLTLLIGTPTSKHQFSSEIIFCHHLAL